jgi:hypothetical protein
MKFADGSNARHLGHLTDEFEMLQKAPQVLPAHLVSAAVKEKKGGSLAAHHATVLS